ncbi:MAG: AAA family ATPase [Lachnospiraceae bacterium]|nr:AAA family ATPase [Lachnospiraceae bacterium]
MKNVRIIGIASDRESLWLESMLNKADVFVRSIMEPTDKNLKEIAKVYAEAVVYYTAYPNEETFAYINKISAAHPNLAVLLMCDTTDPSVYSRAMQAGIGSVISKDADPEEFVKAVATESARIRQRNNGGAAVADSCVIAVFSTKGGTGKTTVAVNMAVSFAKAGKSVCVVDLDLQFGDVGVFMNIPKTETISDFLNNGDFTPGAIDNFLYKHESGVHVLCAPNSPEEADAIHPDHLENTIQAVRNKFDYTVLDLPPVLDDNTIAVIEQADYIWFITNPEISTLKNSKVCMSILQNLSLEKKIRVVLNKDNESSIKQDNVKRVLGTGIELAIPYDYDTAITAVNRGKPFVLSSPRSKASKAFEKYVNTHDDLY